jgi:hypothetical protein
LEKIISICSTGFASWSSSTVRGRRGEKGEGRAVEVEVGEERRRKVLDRVWICIFPY